MLKHSRSRENLVSRFLAFTLILSCMIILPHQVNAITNQKAVFYLFAKPGCYSATNGSSATISMISIKKIYRVPCETPHHFEVFWSGQILTADKNPTPDGKSVIKDCQRYASKVQSNKRNASMYNWSNDEEIFIGNWMADIGPEAKRFPNRVICYQGVTTKAWTFIKEINTPISKGFEK